VYPETALWYVPLDGTPPFDAGDVQVAGIGSSSFSPDAGRIGYLRPLGDINSNQRELVIALSNGSNEMPTINVPLVNFLGWSPDDSQYIYSYNDGALHLFLGNVNNANVQPISTLDAFPATRARIEWVEGSTFVLVLQGDGQIAQISVMDTSGAGTIVANNVPEYDIPFDVSNCLG
jgi:hypothetical protein